LFEEKSLTATDLRLQRARADMLPVQMEEAYGEKIQKYASILLALQHYIHAKGWSIEILVGIRGFADAKHLHAALKYLAISKSEWKDTIEHSDLAPARALAYMHTILCSGAGLLSATSGN
jgi:hypothetical protein